MKLTAILRDSLLIAGFGLALAGDMALARDPTRIGVLVFDGTQCPNRALSEGLRELGHIEGKALILDCRHADGYYANFNPVAAELVRTQPAVIVALGHAPALAAHRATRDIPIVMIASGEPVVAGLITSFARPGGNVTGLSYFNIELNYKRLELLKAVIPDLVRLAVLVDPSAPEDLNRSYIRDARDAGKKQGFQIHVFEASTNADLETVFATMKQQTMHAVFVPPKFRHPGELEKIIALARQHRLPVMHFSVAFTELGGLMTYGTNYAELQQHVARLVDKILRGAKPADLPVEQPTRFEFAINLKTARELGISVPPSILLRADKVIE